MQSKQHQGFKKWCEFCRLNIQANEFQQHQKSRKHIKNKDTELEFRRNKLIREKKEALELSAPNQMILDIEKKAKIAMLEKDGDQDKIKKIIQNNEDGVFDEAVKQNYDFDGFSRRADYSKTQQNEELQEEMKQKMGKGQNKIWTIKKDEKLKKLYFFNSISNEKKFSKPMGLKLSDKEKKQWDEQSLGSVGEEEDKQNNKEVEGSEDDQESESEISEGQQEGKITSQWEEVEADDDYYQKYAAKELNSEEEADEIEKNIYALNDENKNDEKLNKKKPENGGDMLDTSSSSSDNEELQEASKFQYQQPKQIQGESVFEKVERELEEGKNLSEKQMMDIILEEQAKNQVGSLNKTKFKNNKLIKMVEKGIELPSSLNKPMFQKKNFVSNTEQNDEQKPEKKGFKKRVLNNKKAMKVQFEHEGEND